RLPHRRPAAAAPLPLRRPALRTAGPARRRQRVGPAGPAQAAADRGRHPARRRRGRGDRLARTDPPRPHPRRRRHPHRRGDREPRPARGADGDAGERVLLSVRHGRRACRRGRTGCRLPLRLRHRPRTADRSARPAAGARGAERHGAAPVPQAPAAPAAPPPGGGRLMKALHIITGLGVGGAELQLRLLLRHLPVACDVVTLTNPGPVAEGLGADGVRVVHLGMHGNRDLAALPRLVRLIRSGGYDLVHTHLYRACVYGRLAARLAGVRAVGATEHSLGDSQMEGRRLTAGVRALYLASERLGSATVAVSPTVADRLKRWGVPAPRIEVVPNGIDVDRFRFEPERRERTRRRLGLPQGAFVVGGVGRLTRGKRFDVLVRALALLPEDHWLLLVGGGPEEHVLRRTAHEAGVAGRVLFTGERP